MVPYTTPRYVTSVTRRNSSAEICWNGANTEVMALLTQTSTGPSVDSTSSAAASTAAQSATSSGRTRARPPSASTSLPAASNPSRPLAIRQTDAPCWANARAAARPTPAEAPVITTTRRAAMTHPLLYWRASDRLSSIPIPGAETSGRVQTCVHWA